MLRHARTFSCNYFCPLSALPPLPSSCFRLMRPDQVCSIDAFPYSHRWLPYLQSCPRFFLTQAVSQSASHGCKFRNQGQKHAAFQEVPDALHVASGLLDAWALDRRKSGHRGFLKLGRIQRKLPLSFSSHYLTPATGAAPIGAEGLHKS